MNANINSASPLEPPGSDADSLSVDWEARYQQQDTPWDHGGAAPPLLDFLASHPLLGEVIVPGCGLGHDVRALAAQGKSTKIVGLDLSETAIKLARSIPPLGNETYAQGDLFQLTEPWKGSFDWVVEHTCFCAIDPTLRSDYVRAVAELLKPGGYYFAIFYLNPGVDGGPPFGSSREEIASLFDPQLELLKEWVPTESYEGRERRELCQLRIKN